MVYGPFLEWVIKQRKGLTMGGEGEGEHWGVRKTKDDCARDPAGCVTVDACHALSTDACACLTWKSYEEITARSSVVGQQSALPAGEAGAWFGAGLTLALLVCWLMR